MNEVLEASVEVLEASIEDTGYQLALSIKDIEVSVKGFEAYNDALLKD